ncbi:MAG: hypothetical protein GY791_03065 [Alphaproteobacteria bacterium]|nr:hypothetical protein [Alphaproteobacteria bacterium]
MITKTKDAELPIWLTKDGEPVSCLEKIKVLNENLEEIFQSCQDAFEDAILMGCDEDQFREVLRGMVEALENPYASGNRDA